MAVSSTEELLAAFEERLDRLTLLPGVDGVFEVAVNGETVFSRYRLDRFPEEGELVQRVQAHLERSGG